MKPQTKFAILKWLAILVNILTIFVFTSLGVLFGFDIMWDSINACGITSFCQWFTLITYRIIIYFFPGLFLAIFKFDKRYKFLSRLCIWINWTLCIYLITSAFISFFAINKIFDKITIFSNLDTAVLLIGYVLTFTMKKKIDFSSPSALIDKNSYEK